MSSSRCLPRDGRIPLDGGAELQKWTLRFVDHRTEMGFLRARSLRLATNLSVAGMMVFAFSALRFSTYFLPRDSPSNEEMMVVRVRQSTYAAAMLLAVFASVAGKCQKAWGILGVFAFELFVVGITLLLITTSFSSNTQYIAKLFDLNSANIKEMPNEAGTVLTMDAIITCAHLLLPVRWCVFSVVGTWAAVIYASLTFSLGNEGVDSVIYYLMLLCWLIAAASLGCRSVELHERAEFARLISEKSIRTQTEHQLEQASHKLGARRTVQDDVASGSGPSTTYTGQLFDCQGQPSLEKLADTGFREHWLIRAEELRPRVGHILGRGAFGMVLVARYHGAQVALKVPLTSGQSVQPEGLKSLAHELRIARRLHHPNIVLFFGACIFPATLELVLVLEFVRGTHLDVFVCNVDAQPATADRLKLANDVCCALRYLHAQVPCIVHGDLKGSNTLVEQMGGTVNAKLVDFGLARLTTRRAQPMGGTVAWMAPEVLLDPKCPPAPAADVFSFGQMLQMIVTGQRPLDGLSRDEIFSSARLGRLGDMSPWPRGHPETEECREICKACLRNEARDRPDIGEVQERVCAIAASPGEVCAGLEEALELARAAPPPPREREAPNRSTAAASRSEDAQIGSRESEPPCLSSDSCPPPAPEAPVKLAGALMSPKSYERL